MAIKLNGAEITSNKLNSSNVTLENLDGVKVWPTETINLIWRFVSQSSSEPYNYDLLIGAYISGDYEQGITHLNTNYPAGNYNEGFVAVVYDQSTYDFFDYVTVVELEFYEVSSGEYNSAGETFEVTIPELGGALDVMYAFKTQWRAQYGWITSGYIDFNAVVVRADDGHEHSYWALRLK